MNITHPPAPRTPPAVHTMPADQDMDDSYTFALLADVDGTETVVGTHTVYCGIDYGLDHWDGGLALSDYAPGELAARGFEWLDGHFADSCDDNGDSTYTVTYTDYDTDTEHAVVLPTAADGVIFVDMPARRIAP